MFTIIAHQSIVGGKYVTNFDEESANLFVWLVDKALHHDAFIQQTAHLKELKYKVHRMRMTVAQNKMHYGAGIKGNNTKMR